VFVRRITAAEADEIYEVRAAIEALIVERLVRVPERVRESGLGDLLNRSEALAQEADVAACHGLNLEFHERLAELAGNATLLHTYRRLVSELSLFRQQAHERSPDAASLRRSVADHRQIYAALIAGRKPEALRVLRRHIEESRQRLQALLSDSPRNPA
jgi:DNA-binding GntR family transcriptional regulator